MPTYEGTGTYSRQNGDVSLTPAYPASPASGNIFVLQFAHRNVSAQYSATYGVPGDWTQLAAPLTVNPGTTFDRHFSYYKVSDGTETGTITITVTSGTSTGIHQAAIHRFSGAVVDFSEGLNSSVGSSGSNVADAGVTTTGTKRLAVNLVFHNNAFDIISFTGETGGDWTTQSKSDSALTCSIGVQTAPMESAGTVNGGTITSASGLWSVRGFALQPTTGDVTLTPTTGTLALAGNTPSLSTSLAPSTGTLTLAGNSPSITGQLLPSTGTLALIGNSPTISITSGVTLTPTTGTLSLVGNTPSLSVTIAPITGTLGLVGNLPSLQTSYAPTTGTLSLAGNSPTITVGTILTSTTGTLALLGNTPSLSLGISPLTGELTLVGNRPAIFGQEIKAEASEGAVGGGGRGRKRERTLDEELKRSIKKGKEEQRRELLEQSRQREKARKREQALEERKNEERRQKLESEFKETSDSEAGHYSAEEDWAKLHKEYEEWLPKPSRDDERQQHFDRIEREREQERDAVQKRKEAREERKRAAEQAKEKITQLLTIDVVGIRESLSTTLFEQGMADLDEAAQQILRRDELEAQRPNEDAMTILKMAAAEDASAVIEACDLMMSIARLLQSA